MSPMSPTEPQLEHLTTEWRELGVHLGARDLPLNSTPTRPAQPSGIESVVPGQTVLTPCGPCFVAEQRFALDHVHGHHSLSFLQPDQHPAPLLAHLASAPRVSEQEFRTAIFFDIETTGLGIGAGLYAFLVGMGVFEGNEFCLRQFFMRDLGEEEALLYLLEQQMQERTWWISFNGRNFDLPILQARFVCGRRRMPLADAPHLDLLYPARQLWRRRLSSCALSSLEANVLGVPRQNDVPGWLIPNLYFDYLRYGHSEPLRQVFYHNALDVVSLVTLAATANACLQDPLGDAVQHAVDRFSLGTILEAQGDSAQALRAYEQALEQRLPQPLRDETLLRCATLHKKTRQPDKAVHIWHALAKKHNPVALVELAKDSEHRRRDCAAAARLVCEALESEDLPATGDCSAPQLQRRLARLHSKLAQGGIAMPHVESYTFGKIVVDGQAYTKDLLLLPVGPLPNWRRKEGHLLQSADLQDALEAKPAVLIVGSGNPGLMKVPPETLDWLAAQGVRVEVHPTAEACQRYNELAPTERVVAALHLTC